jgi:putative PIN family toxin of toxin-antitoxin system
LNVKSTQRARNAAESRSVSDRKVVFDCNVFAQALLNPDGPSGVCLQAMIDIPKRLLVSEWVIQEITELPDKGPLRGLGVSEKRVAGLVATLGDIAARIDDPPAVFEHPIDEDDSAYINLAIAGAADLIVSRDKHLLNLTNPAKPWSVEFRARFPQIRVISPEALLQELRAELGEQRDV